MGGGDESLFCSKYSGFTYKFSDETINDKHNVETDGPQGCIDKHTYYLLLGVYSI